MTKDQIIHELSVRWVTRDELSQMLGLNERGARTWIEGLNRELRSRYSCVLSTARKSGYHIPNAYDEEDVAIANAAQSELKSKAVSIFERRQAIEDFLRYAESAKAGKVYQPTLF